MMKCILFSFAFLGNSYFRALRRVGLSRVIYNVKNDLLEFFELHIVAAAYISDNQVTILVCLTRLTTTVCLFEGCPGALQATYE